MTVTGFHLYPPSPSHTATGASVLLVFLKRVWNFFAAKDQYQNINAQHLPLLVNIMENSTCVHLKEKKPARLYLKVYFTMPNITVNLKLKARNIRDFLNDKPMPK